MSSLRTGAEQLAQEIAGVRVLFLSNTQVSDLQPFAGLTNLKQLVLVNTQVSDEEIEKLKLALPN